jgi:hypothetical protein
LLQFLTRSTIFLELFFGKRQKVQSGQKAANESHSTIRHRFQAFKGGQNENKKKKYF